MSSSAQDILDFAQDNDVKFVRLAFCDIFGVQKNLAILAEELPYAFDHGIGFDGSSVNGFLNVEESDLLLKPDPSTVTILPWRPMDGRVMRLFCDIYRPNGQPFEGNTRSYLRQVAGRFASLGLTCNVGAECEFYVFELDDRGRPTRIPLDHCGYFDVAPLDKGEDLRREICLCMEEMGLHPLHSHHESGPGQNEVDFRYSTPLDAADTILSFRSAVKVLAAQHGAYASFMPKPFPHASGSGLHINISLYRDGKNLFEGDIAPDSIAGNFIAGVMRRAREITPFLNPIPNSYARFGSCEAPRYVSWSRQNRSQLVRIPAASGDSCRMELRNPDPSCNPYLAIGLVLAAGFEGLQEKMELPAPVNKNLFDPTEAAAYGLESLPTSLRDAVEIARASDFVRRELPDEMARRYFDEQWRQCELQRASANWNEIEQENYFLTV